MGGRGWLALLQLLLQGQARIQRDSGNQRVCFVQAPKTGNRPGAARGSRPESVRNGPEVALVSGVTQWGHLPGIAELDGVERDLVIFGLRLPPVL